MRIYKRHGCLLACLGGGKCGAAPSLSPPPPELWVERQLRSAATSAAMAPLVTGSACLRGYTRHYIITSRAQGIHLLGRLISDYVTRKGFIDWGVWLTGFALVQLVNVQPFGVRIWHHPLREF